MFFAHSLENDPSQLNWHKLQDHLIATGEWAARFAQEFGAEGPAKLTGLLHDLGKYSHKFQRRLHGAAETVDHSTAGAQMVRDLATSRGEKVMAEIMAYAIAGHHAGLGDFSHLQERLSKIVEPIDEIWRQEVQAKHNMTSPLLQLPYLSRDRSRPERTAFQLAFLGRMIFSCLVDADYKDTERFYAAHEGRQIDRDWPDLRLHVSSLIARFDRYLAAKQTVSSDLNDLRSSILRHVRGKASERPGLFTLTVPTGGGKTLTSLGFALDHAKAHNLRRIIYAIPFTSIIEQTVSIFRSVLGDDYVLEHHASIAERSDKSLQQRDKLKLAMEDWAAPVIVTTNVQFFESLFANRPSQCRKLHNLANSIIILDEAQTLPHRLLLPCLAALDELAKHYGATIVLCTATQPAWDVRDFKFGLELEDRELAPNPDLLAQKFKRVHVSKGHVLSNEDLISALQDHEQALVIVNSRKHALDLYRQAQQAGLASVIHLTTRQYAADRREILKMVRQNLSEGKPCRLIATSLVEAGVDIDFPRVWRAEAGLDQIAQAAGRCNREGRRLPEESIVTVFQAKDDPPPPETAQLAGCFHQVADQFDELLSPRAINAYFREVFWTKGAAELDREGVLRQFAYSGGQMMFNYSTVAQTFQMIDTPHISVIVDCTVESAAVFARLNLREASPAKAARDLQSYIVQVPADAVRKLLDNKHLAFFRPDLWDEQFLTLTANSLYRSETGLLWEKSDDVLTTSDIVIT